MKLYDRIWRRISCMVLGHAWLPIGPTRPSHVGLIQSCGICRSKRVTP